MIINTYSHESLKNSEISEDLQSQSTMPEHSHIIGSSQQTIDDLLEDETIVRRFACGKKRPIANENLRISYTHDSLQLSTPTGELIAIHKVAARLHYILVKKDDKYSQLIQQIIGEYQFIPIDTATAERGFMRYQKYEIPAGYTLRYEPADELWQTWQANRHQSPEGLQLDLLILARSKWYRVQDTICSDDRLDIQTRLGLISLSRRDRVAWIAKLGEIPTLYDANLATHQTAIDGNGDSEILGKIISKLAIESAPESDLQFNPYVTISDSTFGTLQDASLSYESDLSSTLTANIISPMKESLQAAALEVLTAYLDRGETIVTTEVVTDADGKLISEKTITTHRSCPKWALEAALYWD